MLDEGSGSRVADSWAIITTVPSWEPRVGSMVSIAAKPCCSTVSITFSIPSSAKLNLTHAATVVASGSRTGGNFT